MCLETGGAGNCTEVVGFRTKGEEDEVLTWRRDGSGDDPCASDVKTSVPTTREVSVSICGIESGGNDINIEEFGPADVKEMD